MPNRHMIVQTLHLYALVENKKNTQNESTFETSRPLSRDKCVRVWFAYGIVGSCEPFVMIDIER